MRKFTMDKVLDGIKVLQATMQNNVGWQESTEKSFGDTIEVTLTERLS